MIMMQEKINLMNPEGPVTLPELAEHPPHRDSDLVTTLQWLHMQIQTMEEGQAVVAPSTAVRRSQNARERSLSAARAYLRNAVEGRPESGRWTVVRRERQQPDPRLGVGLGAVELVLLV